MVNYSIVQAELTPERHPALFASNEGGFYLDSCTFLDGGTSFLNSCTHRKFQSLWIKRFHPFQESNWLQFLVLCEEHAVMDCLFLEDMEISVEACRLLSRIRIQRLRFIECTIHDKKAVSQFRGERLEIYTNESSFEYVPFVQASIAVPHLSLVTKRQSDDNRLCRALAQSVRHCSTLHSLHVIFWEVNTDSWLELVHAVSQNRSLNEFHVTLFTTTDHPTLLFMKAQRTLHVAAMLDANPNIQHMHMNHVTFSSTDWSMQVRPRLQLNVYRKHWQALRASELSSSKLLGAFLGRLWNPPPPQRVHLKETEKCNITFMVLVMNADLLVYK